MRTDVVWRALLSVALLLILAGCATPDGPGGDSPSTTAGAPPVVAAPPGGTTATASAAHTALHTPAVPSPTADGLPDMAASAPLGPSTVSQLAVTKVKLPPPSEDETRYGLQVAQVGMTAGGGLVDLRLKVLDAAKASKLLGNPANAPMLIAGSSPPLQPPHHAFRGAKLGDGLVLFVLYPNVRGAVRHGTEVVVALGDVRLGPVTVQ
jgi:hypothetical protein